MIICNILVEETELEPRFVVYNLDKVIAEFKKGLNAKGLANFQQAFDSNFKSKKVVTMPGEWYELTDTDLVSLESGLEYKAAIKSYDILALM